MARGGRRVGRAGGNFPNRTDLQLAPKAAPGQVYGQAAAQLRAQRALPLTRPMTAGTTPAAGGGGAVPPPSPPPPLDAPTQAPDEPLTAGAPFGAGPGPESLGIGPLPPLLQGPQDDTATKLRALYAAFPNEDLRRLIEQLDED